MGIVFGFLAAFFQSLSYVCTRLFNNRHKNDFGTLLGLSHVMMGVISIPLVIYLMPDDPPSLSEYGVSLAGASAFYLLGQICLFAALIKSEASRVSPLLGLKIIILAFIRVLVLHHPMTIGQWMAVFLCTASAFLLSNSGMKLEMSTLVLVVSACLFYSMSDLNIKILVDHLSGPGVLYGALLGTGLCYIVCGAVGGIYMLFRFPRMTRDTWLYAMPFSLTWLTAMFFLFSCFALVGVTYGNILQSMRGIISIGMGFLLAHMSFERLEPKISRPVLIRRIAAGVMMTASVFLFYRSH